MSVSIDQRILRSSKPHLHTKKRTEDQNNRSYKLHISYRSASSKSPDLEGGVTVKYFYLLLKSQNFRGRGYHITNQIWPQYPPFNFAPCLFVVAIYYHENKKNTSRKYIFIFTLLRTYEVEVLSNHHISTRSFVYYKEQLIVENNKERQLQLVEIWGQGTAVCSGRKTLKIKAKMLPKTPKTPLKTSKIHSLHRNSNNIPSNQHI